MKYVKKISCLILVIIYILSITGCKKTYIYHNEKAVDYLNAYYEYLSDEKQDFIGIDLRDLETAYASGHLKGFISYNYNLKRKRTEDETTYLQRCSTAFQRWIRQNVDKRTTIFLIDQNGTNVLSEAVKLKSSGYKNIHIYAEGYKTLNEYNHNIIPIITGIEDCGC